MWYVVTFIVGGWLGIGIMAIVNAAKDRDNKQK